jgi:hypothetical protein
MSLSSRVLATPGVWRLAYGSSAILVRSQAMNRLELGLPTRRLIGRER